MRKYRIISSLLLASFLIPGIAWCQEDPGYRNNISIAPLPLLTRTLSFSYSRSINENWNFTVNPRFKAGMIDLVLVDPVSMLGNDRYSIYSRALIRSGVTYINKQFFAEPLFQFNYSWANDVWDAEGDDGQYCLRDYSYYSVGLIGLTGIYHNAGKFRLKVYFGLGYHLNFKTVYTKDYFVYGIPEASPPEDWGYVRESTYKRPSVHLGFEVGRNF